MKMEGGSESAVVDVSTSGGATPASSRWNPTKEQITILENLYKQGIRTPTAEQIQQITGRLKSFGHIEGKNVFYWFQNHKARQRQKQKQESLAYFNRYLHKASNVFPPPCPNVVCSPPYYLPQNELGFYPHYPKVLLPGGIKRKPARPDTVENMKTSGGGVGIESAPLSYNTTDHDGLITGDNNSNSKQETLPLFPLEPTGILQARTTSSSLASTTAENSTATPSSSSDTTGIEEGGFGDQPFIDFFSGNNGNYESD
ncbi:unnamed protein product [Camellia sinensis]